MSTTAAKRLVVCGGNGFVGSRICKHAVTRGWDVTSISRSGEPHWASVTSSPSPPAWAHKVSWERADIFRPEQWAPLLKGADYVVHSMGILLEADYKGVISGRESPIAGLRRAFAAGPGASAGAAPSPLEPHYQQQQQQQPPPPAAALTYERMNRDSALILAKEAAREKVSAFCFLSAAAGAPVLPARYLSTKRDAESLISSEYPHMRGVFVRAPFMYDSSRAFTIPMAAAAGLGSLFNRATGGVLGGFLGAGAVKPLKVEDVAAAIVEGLSDDKVMGPVEVPEIEELANKGWRKEML
ncbi:NAD dependent epimerase/dehydratase [Gaeumannomyces tritici R3-111a-1]|uniref:NAD dependent epimerase/dehydratase n=1 Tax=Gaeumannomyces tritici (strain R3-111a-1) TaxID=644352 RepID=J3P934_GAET3|nr:NAD dependent epimerase/dehydratase [Gaeumannomyces tritici R3-111a-1]EJT73169.1 NAD dependent epimerase/dehydratase [Gaeumannomyces tritici R3-111a-1]